MKMNVPSELRKRAQEFIPNKEFNDELTENTKGLLKMFEKGDKDGLVPQLIIHGLLDSKKGNLLVVLSTTGGEDTFFKNKDKIIFLAGEKIAKKMPNFYPTMAFLQSEAWIKSMATKEDEEAIANGESIKNMKGRQEGIVSCGLTIDNRANMSVLQMNKLKNGKIMLGINPLYTYYKDSEEEVKNNLLTNFFAGFAKGRMESGIKDKEEHESN